jgi:hypothetical protein
MGIEYEEVLDYTYCRNTIIADLLSSTILLWDICPFLGNGSVNTFLKHTLSNIGHPQKTVFSVGPAPRRYNSARSEELEEETHVESGSITSTVTLRVVGGDEKGSLDSEAVKYGRESQETRTRERLRWQMPAAYTKDRPILSSERAPHKNKTVTVKQ